MHLVWFRDDLRLYDNPALQQACEQGEAVAAVYIATPQQWQQHDWGPNKIGFIAAHLRTLQQELAQLNIPLHQLQCDDYQQIPNVLLPLMAQLHASTLWFNSGVGVNEQQRDQQVRNHIEQQGWQWHSFTEQRLLDFNAIRTGKNEPYRVFTPFAKKAKQWLQTFPPTPLPRPQSVPSLPTDTVLIQQWQQPPAYQLAWPVGENAAWQTLQRFSRYAMANYQQQRDFPAEIGTSQLSPYLAIGALSAAAIFHHLAQLPASEGQNCWINELLWREFYRYLMWHFPRLSQHQAMYPHKEPQWSTNQHHFTQWQQGKTGYPMVDAGMRQLLDTGWMHNRLRMLCASFLVKDLHLNWRWGEAYFMRHLIDGDLASNNGGWQWAAGCGADAAPYFRHFSPTRQAQRFDPKQQYQQQFLPELNDKQHPYYPPMVDHKIQCRAFTDSIKALSHG